MDNQIKNFPTRGLSAITSFPIAANCGTNANGSKKTKSTIFSYYNKTDKELKEDLLKE